MHNLAKSWLKNLKVYEPGRPIEELARELGLPDASEIVKLASNENPLGPSPKAVAAVREAAAHMHYYSDGGAFYLRRALAQKLNVNPEQVMIANGSNEILEFIGHVFLNPDDEVIIADRSFAIYRLIAGMFQARVVDVPMLNYTHDMEASLRAVTPRTRMIFIDNPCNPTGTMVDSSVLDRFVERLPPHVAVCLDEAYIDLLPPERRPDSLRYIREERKVIVLRTFAKSHGLAGLRVGYAVAREQTMQAMNKVRQPFNVNALALTAALAALDDDEHVRRFRNLVRTEKAFMTAGLERLGLEYVPSVANFLMVDVGDGRRVFNELQKELVIVRPLNGYGLPRHVRISIGTHAENEKCLMALGKVNTR